MVFSGIPSLSAPLRSSPIRSTTANSIPQHTFSLTEETCATDVLKPTENQPIWYYTDRASQRVSCLNRPYSVNQEAGAHCASGFSQGAPCSGSSIARDCDNESPLSISGRDEVCRNVEVERLRETCQVLFSNPLAPPKMAANGKRAFMLSAGLHTSGIDSSLKSGYTAESSCETNTNLLGAQLRQRSTSARQFLSSFNSSIEYTTYLGWHTLSSDLSEKIRQGSIRVNRHNTLEYATIDEERAHGDKVPLLRRVQSSGSMQGKYIEWRKQVVYRDVLYYQFVLPFIMR